MIRIECRTRFDITVTDVRGHFRPERLPFVDATGRSIHDHAGWTRSRNQQRNWETVNQIISLRCLPENITVPRRLQHQDSAVWSFEFEVPDPASVSQDDDAVGWLRQDCEHVPMITGLDESPGVSESLDPVPGGNIDFCVDNNK